MTNQLRRVVAGTAAITAATILVACGSNNDSAGPGEEATTEQEQVNERVASPPNFSQSNDRFAAIEAGECNTEFEDWSHDMVVYLTDVNGGDWEHVKTEVKPTTVAANMNACEINVTGAQITGTPGGDLNDFTITATGLTKDSNSGNPEAHLALMDMARAEKSNELEISDVNLLANLNPVMNAAVSYGNAHGASFTGDFQYGERKIDGHFSGEDTYLTAYSPVDATKDGEIPPAAQRQNGWAAVTTNDPQKETDRDSGTAAGQFSQFFTYNMNNKMQSDSWYTIKSS